MFLSEWLYIFQKAYLVLLFRASNISVKKRNEAVIMTQIPPTKNITKKLLKNLYSKEIYFNNCGWGTIVFSEYS